MPRSDIRYVMRSSNRAVICNTEDASLSFTGCICRPNDDGGLVAARANTAANAKAAFFLWEGHRNRAIMLGNGPVQVRLVSGLNSGTAPAIGQLVYLSAATAGKATNVEPTGGTNQSVKLGYIQDLGPDGYDNTNGSLVTIVAANLGTPGGAAAVAYTPEDGTDWGTDPDDVAEALDQLAARLTVQEGALTALDARVTALE